MKPLISLLLSLVFAVTLFAQKEDVAVETDLPATLVRAVKLPLPDYPEAAKNAGLRGMVSVDVTLDEEGKVLYAENARGPYPVCQSVTDPAVVALRNSALAAAKKARFKGVDGQANGPIRGRITYTFGSGPPSITKIGSSDGVARVVDSGEARIVGTNGTDPKGTTDTMEMRVDRATQPRSSEKGVRVAAPGESTSKGNIDPSTLGVLNGKATTLAKPPYPPAAKAVRATGTVSVQVLISEDGSVYSAAAVAGHPLLRAASEIAACNSGFTPTLLAGNPVKVMGVIVYNFVP